MRRAYVMVMVLSPRAALSASDISASSWCSPKHRVEGTWRRKACTRLESEQHAGGDSGQVGSEPLTQPLQQAEGTAGG